MTIKAYDVFSKTYKKENFEPDFWLSEFNILLKLMKKDGIEIKGSRFLDLGCGVGRDALLALGAGMEYVGIDLSRGMLSIAKKIIRNADFRKMDVTKLEFGDNQFDVVWAAAILLHLSSVDLNKALKEIKRVLKSGCFVFVSLEKHRKGRKRKSIKVSMKGNKKVRRFFALYTEPEFRKILETKGFEVLKVTSKVEPGGEKEWLCFFAKN